MAENEPDPVEEVTLVRPDGTEVTIQLNERDRKTYEAAGYTAPGAKKAPPAQNKAR